MNFEIKRAASPEVEMIKKATHTPRISASRFSSVSAASCRINIDAMMIAKNGSSGLGRSEKIVSRVRQIRSGEYYFQYHYRTSDVTVAAEVWRTVDDSIMICNSWVTSDHRYRSICGWHGSCRNCSLRFGLAALPSCKKKKKEKKTESSIATSSCIPELFSRSSFRLHISSRNPMQGGRVSTHQPVGCS